jgi:type VI secretion system secreted protein VgrG
MAQLVKTTIYIGKTEVKQFTEFSLKQGIFAHHSFTLVCPADVFEKPGEPPFSGTQSLIGNPFKISISNYNGTGNMLQFAGLVTQVDAHKFNGHVGDVVITGYSPTIVMDAGAHCKTWQNKPLKNIISDVTNVFANNEIKVDIKPLKNEALGYIVQYKETAWQFLNRMAAKQGEWLFYNGKEITIGDFTPKNIKLVFGSDLNDFSMSMQLRPVSFSNVAYDFMNNKVHEATPSGIPEAAGLNSLGKFAHQQSEAFFASTPKRFDAQFVNNKTQLNDTVNRKAAAESSNLVRFTGHSANLMVQLGNEVQISNNNGNYKIIEVIHTCDGQGNYSNTFIAIPASILPPPVTLYKEPYCETQSAVVTDNFDKHGLGRVKVRFHWMNQQEESPWLRVCSPHSGNGKGMFFVPEKGEEVIVGFEADSPEIPFIHGTVHNGGERHDFSNDGNDVKVLRTRSGTRIIYNDKQGSITIADPSGNIWFMDGAGNIEVTAPKNFTLNAGDNVAITAGKNMMLNAGINKNISVGMLMNTFVGGNHMLQVEGDSIENITGNFTAESKEREEVAASINKNSTEKNIHLNGKQKVKVDSGEKSNLF